MSEHTSFDTITPDFLDSFRVEYDAAWRDSSGAQMAALCADDVVWDDAALTEPASGPTEVAAFIRFIFRIYPDVRYDAPDPPAIAADGKTAYWKWILTGTNSGPIDPPGFAATGRHVEFPGIDQYRFTGGLLVHYTCYYNMHDQLTQLGLTPTRDSVVFKALVRLQRLTRVRPRPRPSVGPP